MVVRLIFTHTYNGSTKGSYHGHWCPSPFSNFSTTFPKPGGSQSGDIALGFDLSICLEKLNNHVTLSHLMTSFHLHFVDDKQWQWLFFTWGDDNPPHAPSSVSSLLFFTSSSPFSPPGLFPKFHPGFIVVHVVEAHLSHTPLFTPVFPAFEESLWTPHITTSFRNLLEQT